MPEEKDTQNECLMDPVDSSGDTNLCCCYLIDEEGNYEDPCYTPVEESCCC